MCDSIKKNPHVLFAHNCARRPNTSIRCAKRRVHRLWNTRSRYSRAAIDAAPIGSNRARGDESYSTRLDGNDRWSDGAPATGGVRALRVPRGRVRTVWTLRAWRTRGAAATGRIEPREPVRCVRKKGVQLLAAPSLLRPPGLPARCPRREMSCFSSVRVLCELN